MLQGGPKKLEHFCELTTPVYDDIEWHFIYQNVQLFIWSKTDILNLSQLSIFKSQNYSTLKITIYHLRVMATYLFPT